MKFFRFILPLLLGLIVLFPYQARSQRNVVLNMPRYDDELFHFGFVLAVNQSFVTIQPISDLRTHIFDSTYLPDILPTPDSARVLSIQGRPIPGFTISIVSDLRLGKRFNLRFVPSLSFGDRDLFYTIQSYHNGDTLLQDFTKKSSFHLHQFPT